VNTLKSAALVVVLLGVLYAVYVALNKPEPPPQPGESAADVTSPSIEFGGSTTQHSPPPLTNNYDDNPAVNGGRSVRGGVYQPAVDPTSLPPPTSPSASVPVDPTAGTGSTLQRSTYETPAVSPASEALASQSSSQSSSSVAPASATSTSPSLTAYGLRRDLADVEQLAASGKYKSALAKLTPYYANTDLTSDQREVVMSWLDALAGKVIYSREHLLTSAHQVRKGETLYDVAHQYNVEYRLLQNINRREVSDPLVLIPATELKVIPGPFRADLNLTTGEMTLLVGDLYAGRFPFALGDQPPQPGDYKVIDKKSQQKTYIGFDGRMIPANDPNNPYGGWWLSLGGELAIHGSPASPAPRTLGCISLSSQDAEDIYGILSIGSEVKIRR